MAMAMASIIWVLARHMIRYSFGIAPVSVRHGFGIAGAIPTPPLIGAGLLGGAEFPGVVHFLQNPRIHPSGVGFRTMNKLTIGNACVTKASYD